MPTEKTPLTSTSPNFGSVPAIPFYVQDTYRLYSRRRRERQLQCIMFVTIVATFIMALVVTVSYSVNHPDARNASEEAEAGAGALLKWSLASAAADDSSGPLSAEELRLAVEAGNAAIAARRRADAEARPLPEASPESRHQFAVGTGPRAGRMAIAGVAEIAATRQLESSRSLLGRPSGFGSFLDGGWAAAEACAARASSAGCPLPPAKYRRLDGSCNQPRQLGAAFAAYRRALPADYADGIDAPRRAKFGGPLPSAREISLKVHPPSPSTNPSFTVMLAVFGQFLDHDMTATAISQGINGSSLSCCPPMASGGHPECFPVKVGPGDPVYDIAASSCMEFVRSAPAAQCRIGPRQQLNQVTAFIDGSTIYGSDLETANSLREFSGGRLRMQKTPDNRELLPASRNSKDGCNQQVELARGRYCFASGDRRANENLHLTTMHVLWARQHNLLVDRLSQLNPQWDDERLYQEARRIVGAQLQHISYREFLPIVLGEAEVTRRNLKPLSSGFRALNGTDVDPTIANNFAAAAFRFAHTLLPGLMKVTDAQKGTSSYVELHKMLFNPYSLYAQGGLESSITSATTNPIQKTSTHVTSQLTEHLFEDPTGNQTTVPCGLDLVSLNIQRGRDHGLPGYTKWREHCGLGNPLKFDDLKDDMDPEALDAISKLYDNVDDIDLYTGALAELPKGMGLLGPTFTCLIADQFERLQLGDRYWYESADQPGPFNQAQLNEIRKTTLAGIICDTSDGIIQVQKEVMRAISGDNLVVSCEDISKLSIDAWKSEVPMLTLSETEVPFKDWIYFKYEVNKTLTDLLSKIIDKKPPPGTSPVDWLDFKTVINQTFTDLKNKFNALQPKIVRDITFTRNITAEQEVFDWTIIKNYVDNTVSDIIDVISANKPPPGSLPIDWIEFKKKINNSLIDIKKKYKNFHFKNNTLKSNSENISLLDDLTIQLTDWTQIKNNINSTITDIVSSINSSKPLPGSPSADWFEFKSKIVNTLLDIKNKFKNFNPKTPSSIENLSTITNDSMGSKKPLANNTFDDWLQFQKEVNNNFFNLDRNFNIKSDQLMSDEFDKGTGSNVNKTLMEIIAEINSSKPEAGSPQLDWDIFRQKVTDAFANIKKNKYFFSQTINKTTVELSKAMIDKNLDLLTFREHLNNSLNNLISVIKNNRPGINGSISDWFVYKKDVNVSFNKIKDLFSEFKIKELLEPEYTIYAGESDNTFDWIDWKTEINKTIDILIDQVKNISLSDDANWISFRTYLIENFGNLKNKASLMRNKILKPTLMAVVEEDWSDFKGKVKETIEESLDDINNNKPAPDDPGWLNHNVYIKNRLAEMHEDLQAIQTEWLENLREATNKMIVADVSVANNSASLLRLSLFNFRILFLSIVYVTHFM